MNECRPTHPGRLYWVLAFKVGGAERGIYKQADTLLTTYYGETPTQISIDLLYLEQLGT